MNTHTRFPFIGFILREIITRSGYRRFFEERRLDKDLDDLAIESNERKSTLFDLITYLEEEFIERVSKDCGFEWAQTFWFGWVKTKESYQDLVRNSEIISIPQSTASSQIDEHFFRPMVVWFLKLANDNHVGPSINAWIEYPFQEWIKFATSKTGLSKEIISEKLMNHLQIDYRTIFRWLSGEPIGKVTWPLNNVVNCLTDDVKNKTHLSGWLMLTCLLQSLSSQTRAQLLEKMKSDEINRWSVDASIKNLNKISEHYQSDYLGFRIEELHYLIKKKIDLNALDSEVSSLLNMLNNQLSQIEPTKRMIHQYRYDWLKAKFCAYRSNESDAMKHFKNAVSMSWWCGGLNIGEILEEALMYAVGIGDKNAANIFWDKTFILGLNHAPKRELDKFELRRIAIGFEKHFYPLQAKERIPTERELLLIDQPFSLTEKDLIHPNRKTAYADGKTRRTAFMNAIMEGTLEHVMEMAKAGADPNSYIPESNEGPLIYALRRACDRKDTSIIDYLLSLEITKETVNRPASSFRETPLKLAIEMGNAKIVSKLIELGADIEANCDYMPSALCFAIQMFYHSLNYDDENQITNYLTGQTRADGYDAKKGYVLDISASIPRSDIFRTIYANHENQQLFSEVKKYFFRDPERLSDVIKVLVEAGANCNIRYRVEAHHLAKWTPTLFAAQIGDLKVFRIMVEHQGANKGDLESVLIESNEFIKYDALWIAVEHEKNEIVEYLKKKQQHLA